MGAKKSWSAHPYLLTFTGGGYGTVIPLQVGGGEGGERVQGQAVWAGQPFLKVQQVLGFVVFWHVGGHIQIGHILNQQDPTEALHTVHAARSCISIDILMKYMLTSSRSKRMNSRPDTSVRKSVRWSWLQTSAFLAENKIRWLRVSERRLLITKLLEHINLSNTICNNHRK